MRLLHAGHADHGARHCHTAARCRAARIRTELSGNLCRCTGYVGIVRAISRVLDERRLGKLADVTREDGPLGPVGARRAGPATGPMATATVAASRLEPERAVPSTRLGSPAASRTSRSGNPLAFRILPTRSGHSLAIPLAWCSCLPGASLRRRLRATMSRAGWRSSSARSRQVSPVRPASGGMRRGGVD